MMKKKRVVVMGLGVGSCGVRIANGCMDSNIVSVIPCPTQEFCQRDHLPHPYYSVQYFIKHTYTDILRI